jgi:hypothetical protein
MLPYVTVILEHFFYYRLVAFGYGDHYGIKHNSGLTIEEQTNTAKDKTGNIKQNTSKTIEISTYHKKT